MKKRGSKVVPVRTQRKSFKVEQKCHSSLLVPVVVKRQMYPAAFLLVLLDDALVVCLVLQPVLYELCELLELPVRRDHISRIADLMD